MDCAAVEGNINVTLSWRLGLCVCSSKVMITSVMFR